ncbi:hypothetical protein [Streptomyces fuscichromogenes]|uniref:hypothetical protein n=1 Tax=Streptomyces fuscichromogenes TaxID=1324013 RepID=UPI001E55F9FC|nr:hypothetical protein [Streptomyces fuscichromogenes]
MKGGVDSASASSWPLSVDGLLISPEETAEKKARLGLRGRSVWMRCDPLTSPSAATPP